MTILHIASQKGGSGKTTLAVNIAVALAQQQQDVLLVDADRQISTTTWWAERQLAHPDKPKIHCVQKYDQIDATLLDLSERYQVVIVDTPGHDSDAMRSAMIVADILIVPFRPSSLDLDTLPSMTHIIKQAGFINSKLHTFAYINSAPTNSKDVDVSYAKATIGQYPCFTVADAVLYDRRVYRDAMPMGLGVLEMTGKSASESSARAELNALIKEVCNGTHSQDA